MANLKPFLSLVTFTEYANVNLNRDESGMAKTMIYGDTVQTTASPQCTKKAMKVHPSLENLKEISRESSKHYFAKIFRTIWEKNVLSDAKKLEDLVKKMRSQIEKDGKVPKDQKDAEIAEDTESDEKAKQDKKIKGVKTGSFDLDAIEKSLSNTSQNIHLNPLETNEIVRFLIEEVIPANDPISKIKTFDLRNSNGKKLSTLDALYGSFSTYEQVQNVHGSFHMGFTTCVTGHHATQDLFTRTDALSGEFGNSGASHLGYSEIVSGIFQRPGYLDIDLHCENVFGKPFKDIKADPTALDVLITNLVTALIIPFFEATPTSKKTATAPMSAPYFAFLTLTEYTPYQPFYTVFTGNPISVTLDVKERIYDRILTHTAQMDVANDFDPTTEKRAYFAVGATEAQQQTFEEVLHCQKVSKKQIGAWLLEMLSK